MEKFNLTSNHSNAKLEKISPIKLSIERVKTVLVTVWSPWNSYKSTGEWELEQTFWELLWVKNLEMLTPFDSVIPLFGIFLKELIIRRNEALVARMLIMPHLYYVYKNEIMKMWSQLSIHHRRMAKWIQIRRAGSCLSRSEATVLTGKIIGTL